MSDEKKVLVIFDVIRKVFNVDNFFQVYFGGGVKGG